MTHTHPDVFTAAYSTVFIVKLCAVSNHPTGRYDPMMCTDTTGRCSTQELPCQAPQTAQAPTTTLE